LNGGPAFRHSEAFSCQVATDDQAETDHVCGAIVANGGQESGCGWCKERWCLSWKITPRALTDALVDPDRAATMRVFNAIILETAVGRARAGRDGPRWQGANHSDALRHRADSQRCQCGPAWLDRVRSGLTQEVKYVVASSLSTHAADPAGASGSKRSTAVSRIMQMKMIDSVAIEAAHRG